MEKVSFRLITAFQVTDSLNGQLVRDYRIECDSRIKRVNKDNGIVVLTYVPDHSSPVSKNISIIKDRYQTYTFEGTDDLGNIALKIPMVPTRDQPVPDTCSCVFGKCNANETVVLNLLTKKSTINEEIPSIIVKADNEGEYYIAFALNDRKSKARLTFKSSGNISDFSIEPGEKKEIKEAKLTKEDK